MVFYSIPSLSKYLGVPQYRVRYVLDNKFIGARFKDIGGRYVFEDGDIQLIKRELERIDNARKNKNSVHRS